ncbi:MAG: HAD family phosphatase [Thermoanaerobaculia bacterium]|nr:HAD family phosphatase [Thermoanaerobaculia bacterium]
MTLSLTPRPRNFPARLDAAIFDFDETIIDLEAQHTAAAAMLCRDYGSDYLEMPEEFRHGSGRRVIDDIRDLREYFGWSATLDQLAAVRLDHFDEACRSGPLALMPGVERAIRTLKDAGVPLAITSSAVRSSIEAILERFDLRKDLALIVDGSEVAQPKPHPEPYLVTASKLRAEPANCLVFEDSSVGVVSAKDAGMCCVAVRNPRALSLQDLSAADLVVESFDAITFARTGR